MVIEDVVMFVCCFDEVGIGDYVGVFVLYEVNCVVCVLKV